MNTMPYSNNKKFRYKQSDKEIEYIFNILAPDLLLFTIVLSFVFALLIVLFKI